MAKKQFKFFVGEVDSNGQYTGYRLAFKPNLATPRAFNDGDTEKYDLTLIVPKTDKAGIKRIKDAVNGAIDATDWSAKAKQQVKKTAFEDADGFGEYALLKDGDARNERAEDEGATTYDQRAGCYTLKLTRKASFGPPIVVDADAQPIPSMSIEGAIMAGYWVNVQAIIYCYDYQGKKGVSIQFDAVQVVKADDVFGQSNPFEAVEIEPVEVDSSGDSQEVFE